MNTVAAWIKEHPRVNVLAFEQNFDKSSGFGGEEEVCGFCLASHYFDQRPPEFCRFCRAPLWATHVLSELAEITERTYDLGWLVREPEQPAPHRLILVRKDP
jgi:hypothetical protein